MAAGTSIAEWVSATPEERGGALLDLLELADRLPAPHRAKLTMPPLRGRAGGG